MPYFVNKKTRLYYQVFGTGAPAILLAGMSLDSRVWNRVVNRLQNKILTVSMDLRGSGQSDAPRGHYSIPQMATDVICLITELGLTRSVLVGHSLGGFVAQEVAVRRPDLLGGLALVSTSAVGQGTLLRTTPRARKVLSNNLGPLEDIARNTADVGFGTKAKIPDSPIIEEFVAMRLDRPPRGRGFVGQRAAAEKFDMRLQLSQISTESIVLHGEEDEIIALENGEFLASSLPRANLFRLPGVGHFPQIEVPELVAQKVGDFVHDCQSAHANRCSDARQRFL